MRKKLIEALFLCSALYFLSGCAQLGNTLYDPVVSTTEVDTPEGKQTLVSTNGWVLNPSIAEGITTIGAIAPFPWSGLAANALIGALAVFGHIRSKKWRAATISAVGAAQEFKEQLSRLDQAAAAEAKAKVKTAQKIKGTQPLIQQALAAIDR
jgi:hypothetical protein